MIGIYKITSPSGKIYIGQSIDIERRKKQYIRGKLGTQFRLDRSFKKYGFEKHKFTILILCEEYELNEYEFYYQNLYECIGPNGLNCVIHDVKNKTVQSCSDSKKRKSESKKGSKNPFYGKKFSKEHREKISKANKGRVSPNKGGTISQERKDKIKLNNSKYWLGKKYSEERIQKMSDESVARKLVLNFDTGIFFDSVKDAAFSHCINYNSLMGMINPNKKTHRNKTSLYYV